MVMPCVEYKSNSKQIPEELILSLNKKKINWFRQLGIRIIQYLKWMCSYPVNPDDFENNLRLQTSCSNAVLCYNTVVEYQNIPGSYLNV